MTNLQFQKAKELHVGEESAEIDLEAKNTNPYFVACFSLFLDRGVDAIYLGDFVWELIPSIIEGTNYSLTPHDLKTIGYLK